MENDEPRTNLVTEVCSRVLATVCNEQKGRDTSTAPARKARPFRSAAAQCISPASRNSSVQVQNAKCTSTALAQRLQRKPGQVQKRVAGPG